MRSRSSARTTEVKQTPIIDMFSGTGELARAVSTGLEEPTRHVSFSNNYGPARKYLRKRFLRAQIARDFREQIVPGLSVSAQRRLAGNAVVGLQARLMLYRGLTATNDTRGTFS